jgi:hypothetical protein
MATYGEYLARGIDPAAATSWAAADAADGDDESENAARQHSSPSEKQPNVLSEALNDARLRISPAPYPAIGHDSTGVVGLHVDRDHTPLRLELGSDWSEDLAVPMLPSAILSAYRAALARQYRDARIAFDDEACQPIPPPESSTPVEGYRCAPRSARDIGDDVRDCINRADSLIEELRAEAVRRERDTAPTAATRSVDVQLDGPWLTVCQINAEWAAEVTAARLMTEFSVAVQRAQDESEEAAPSPLDDARSALVAELNSLARESLDALRNLAEG